GGLMLAVAIGATLAAVGGMYFSARVGMAVGRDLREGIFDRVQAFSLRAFDQLGTSSLVTRTTNDTTQVQLVLVMILGTMLSAPVTMAAGIILALHEDAGLAWVLIVAVPILAAAILILLSQTVPLFGQYQVKLDKLNLVVDEGLTGVRVIRAFNREQHEAERFDHANLDLTNLAITVNRLMALLWPIMMIVLNLTTLALIWFGSLRVAAGNLQVGQMMAFLQYALQILFSMLAVSFLFVALPRAQAAAVRIHEVLTIKPQITDPPQPRRADRQRGRVEFRDVTFSYPGAETPALAHISFTAAPGQITAIIGGTGSGKSTLVNLIPRFYEVDSGAVLVDGVDVRELTQDDLRRKIGFVPQQAVLFSGTIAKNIRYGKDEASDGEVWHAAEVAQATEFINALPDKLEATIAQGGTNVSGGQKQRLAIARALVRRPEIYVFDDSFSALDYKTDARLRAALQRETQDATVLIVSQRVSTVMNADQILVLDEGMACAAGTHHELMEQCDVYREIVTSQLSSAEIADQLAQEMKEAAA
ncbi:MAG TPA: ABC transporter ATP-binding protein, partial [Candidatus Edwardsbacteria bacterium]|nr:ABC transporter ATP-binding protein [Candidatus Edwardsbacteria bacterium]